MTHPLCRTLALAGVLGLVSLASAEAGPFKPGDRVACDWMQNGNYDAGTVVPFEKNDLDKSGRWYRVKLDKDTIPGSTVECMANRLRGAAADRDQNEADAPAQRPAPRRAPQPPAKAAATRYKPGDRVECDKAQIGIWEKGIVVPYLPSDGDTASGRYYRVKLDGYTLYPAGHECLTNFMRPLAGAGISGLVGHAMHKVGDVVEALNSNNSWLRARIVAIENGFYKVRFEGRDARYDESVDEKRLRPAGTLEREAAEQRRRDQQRQQPTPTGGPAPNDLPGTAWKIDFGKGLTGAVFLFCRSGSWSMVLANGTIGAVGSSYDVSGSTLTTVNKDDGLTTRWRMNRAGDVLAIDDGRRTLRLHYNGETQCR